MLKHLVRVTTLTCLSVSLVACATAPGTLNGLSGDPAAMAMIHKNPLYGDMTTQDWETATYLLGACKKDADRQMAILPETVVTAGAVNAAGGALLGPAARAAFGAAVSGSQYTKYGMGANGGAGLAQGVQTHSFARVAVIAGCANADLGDALAREKAPGMHIIPSYTRTNNRSNKPPSWVKSPSEASGPTRAPEWSELEGPIAPVAPPPL